MNISISQINLLRKKTGVGVIDCKNALIHSCGDIEKAIIFLRKKGKKIFHVKSNTEIKEGSILSSVNSDCSIGTIVGISCETDFLSRSVDFLKLLNKVSQESLYFKGKDKTEFLKSKCKNGNSHHSIQDMIHDYLSIFKEKIELKIFEKREGRFIANYTHNYKIATLLGFSSKLNHNIARDIAMHVTAMDPLFIKEKHASKILIKNELEIIKSQIKKEKKPENILNKIIRGKLKKFLISNSLIHQYFIKNHKITIKDYLRNHDKNVLIRFFKRIKI
ncbi:translation elongation factor Ts [Blattabacterium cuenoti]|uniref:translation elongation factor Ts n=1 Tax=Blattabacterium cuenoti TaxID=1653831 RepID=UPI00163C3AB3|nr:translation elongation factor Ts [Blattabacterium cuenoti]